MVLKISFGGNYHSDYIYVPSEINFKKYKIKDEFYNWIDNTEDKSRLIESFSSKKLDYDLVIKL
ncbi:hypothetical protein ACTPEO_16470 [Clostridioides difficile]